MSANPCGCDSDVNWVCERHRSSERLYPEDVEYNPSIREAWKLTHGDRRAAYGNPADVFAGYAKVWSGLLGSKLRQDLTAADVALMMTALKLARQCNCPKQDNITDAHGYLIMHEEVR